MMKRTSLLMGTLVCVFSVAAVAAPLVLTPPTGGFLGYGAGGTRGDLITMTGTYALTSIGIQGAINSGQQMTFNAYVYDGTGTTPLAVGSAMTFTGTGVEQWFDLPISYTLQSGQSYDIGIAFNSFNSPVWQVHYYFFDSGSNAPFSVGPVTVWDGEESHCGGCNSFSPNLQLNGGGTPTPEPGSLALLGTGALALLGGIRRKLNF